MAMAMTKARFLIHATSWPTPFTTTSDADGKCCICSCCSEGPSTSLSV